MLGNFSNRGYYIKSRPVGMEIFAEDQREVLTTVRFTQTVSELQQMER